MGENRGVYRILLGKPQASDHLGDPGVDEDNYKMDLQKV
jgi:hypothetical protein